MQWCHGSLPSAVWPIQSIDSIIARFVLFAFASFTTKIISLPCRRSLTKVSWTPPHWAALHLPPRILVSPVTPDTWKWWLVYRLLSLVPQANANDVVSVYGESNRVEARDKATTAGCIASPAGCVSFASKKISHPSRQNLTKVTGALHSEAAFSSGDLPSGNDSSLWSRPNRDRWHSSLRQIL